MMIIPKKEGLLLVRSLGLLLSQVAVYGAEHKVARDAVSRVYLELEPMLAARGDIEIALVDDRVLLNGQAHSLEIGTGRILAERFKAHELAGITLSADMQAVDFLYGIKCLSLPPNEIQRLGGMAAALQTEHVRGLTVVTMHYRRAAADESAAPEGVVAGMKGDAASIDELSAAWELDFGRTEAAPVVDQPSAAAAGAAMCAMRQSHAAQLAQLMRETAQLLEQDETFSDAEQHLRMLQTITEIRDELIAATAHSERNIADLAYQVDNDRPMVEDLEAAARRHGIGIKLTRAELIRRYAELNQEIVQPLTVTAGVVELLESGKTGDLSESQQEMLRLAGDSIERVNQLVAYMSRIAGLPEGYAPDGAIIEDSYRV